MKFSAQTLRRLGFKRWYERQLIESHLWLVTCILAIILVACGIELLSTTAGWHEFFFDGSLVAGGLALGWMAWRRYAWQMMMAELVGSQAECQTCRRYGFAIVKPADQQGPPAPAPQAIQACCRRCGHTWWVVGPP